VSAVVAIGEEALLAGYALVGVTVVAARDAAAARAAWETLPSDAQLVLLTAAARAALGSSVRERTVLCAVLPS
jgi:vacuolar-type H+-ATPase subunit F/Vma7